VGRRIHNLSHSLASALTDARTPLYEIGALLGHRQLRTTTRYAHHTPERLDLRMAATSLCTHRTSRPESSAARPIPKPYQRIKYH